MITALIASITILIHNDLRVESYEPPTEHIVLPVPQFKMLESDIFIRRLKTKKYIIEYLIKTEDIRIIEKALSNTDDKDALEFLKLVINDWFYRDLSNLLVTAGNESNKKLVLMYEENLRHNKITRLFFLSDLLLIK